MEITWVAVGASLCMGLGAGYLFVFVVKKDWIRDVQDEKLSPASRNKETHGGRK